MRSSAIDRVSHGHINEDHQQKNQKYVASVGAVMFRIRGTD